MGFEPVVIIDTREQKPLRFSDKIRTASEALTVGDYSIRGFEDQFVIERKSLSDLLGCLVTKKPKEESRVAPGRDRFVRELRQLRTFRVAVLLIESNWPTILSGMYGCPSQIHPNAIIGSLMAFTHKYGVIPVLGDDHATCSALAERLIVTWFSLIERDYKLAVKGA